MATDITAVTNIRPLFGPQSPPGCPVHMQTNNFNDLFIIRVRRHNWNNANDESVSARTPGTESGGAGGSLMCH